MRGIEPRISSRHRSTISRLEMSMCQFARSVNSFMTPTIVSSRCVIAGTCFYSLMPCAKRREIGISSSRGISPKPGTRNGTAPLLSINGTDMLGKLFAFENPRKGNVEFYSMMKPQ